MACVPGDFMLGTTVWEWQSKYLRVSIQEVRTGWLCSKDLRDTRARHGSHQAASATF